MWEFPGTGLFCMMSCLLKMRIARVIFNKHLCVEMCLNWAESLQPSLRAVVLLRNSALSCVVWISLGIFFPFQLVLEEFICF